MKRSAVLGAVGPRVFFCDSGGERSGDRGELAERASDRWEADALQRLAEVLPGGVELLPELGGAAAAAVGPQLGRGEALGGGHRVPAEAFLCRVVAGGLLRLGGGRA